MTICLKNVFSGYDNFHIKNISIKITKGSLTVLIGPNGCGKSTLLKTISQHIHHQSGQIKIANKNIDSMSVKEIAKNIAMLPQDSIFPSTITIEKLVSYGRAPHQNFMGFKTKKDYYYIDNALDTVNLYNLRNRSLGSLSGGQRQRAFIAMCIAQNTPYILFDEPTSYLDIKYQYEVLDLMAKLNFMGKTVIVVLHDIAHAARYASELIIMKDGMLYKKGDPQEIITADMIEYVYGIKAYVYNDPITNTKVASIKDL